MLLKLAQWIKHRILARYALEINAICMACLYDSDYYIINKKLIDTVMVDGYQYKWDKAQGLEGIYRKNSLLVKQTWPGDIVLSIGANIGAEAIPLSRIAKRVYAVEPISYNLLLGNIELNHARNITAYQVGLGATHGMEWITFNGTTKLTPIYPFKWFMKQAGGHVDYLCCDCEGPEWYIDIEDCKDIRAFWIEFHLRRKYYAHDLTKYHLWLDYWHSNGYEVAIRSNPLGSTEDFKVCFHVYAHVREAKG